MAIDQGQPITILAVDDEPSVLELVRRCLKDPRIAVIEAASGPEALARLSNGPALDLLIADWQMPAMTGDELARQMRARQPELKVLYLTGHVDGLFGSVAQLQARDAYLDKPFTREGLREAVALLLFGCTALRMAPRATDAGKT